MEVERNDNDAMAAADREARAKARAMGARDEAEQQTRQAQADALQQQQAAQAEAERNRAAAAAASADEQLQQAQREKQRAPRPIAAPIQHHPRDSRRGLVVNMSDVLFDTGKHALRPIAREKLAKISGIMLAYPGLKLGIEGNTDSVGGDDYNQGLSERRAESVRSYLSEQGIPGSSMTAVGIGKTQPIASNDTADGRQQNRRVELVVSGEVIGTTIGELRMQPTTLSQHR